MPTEDYSSIRNRNLQHALQALRERAEKRRELATQVTDDKTPAEVQRLVQELQVTQIELEMQYEELLVSQAESESLRARYTDLFDFAPIGYLSLDVLGLVQELNLAAGDLLGVTRRRLQGRRFLLFVAPHCRDRFLQFMIDVLASDHTLMVELELQREDHSPVLARLQGLALPDAYGTKVCRLAIMDVTAERQAKRELEISEARFRTLFEQNQDGMVLVENGRYVAANAAALRMVGLTDPRQLIGQPLWAFSPETQPTGRRSEQQASENLAEAQDKGWHRYEWVRQRANGETFWCDVLLTTLPEEGRTLIHGAWRDITAEKLAEQRIRESEERLSLAMKASGSGAWIWELDSDRLLWDQQARHIFGYDDPQAHPSFDVIQRAVHPDDSARVKAELQDAIRGRKSFDLEHRILCPDGVVRHVRVVGQVLEDDHHRPARLAGLVRDVTEEKRHHQLLRTAVINTQEEERQRIAEALHNGVGQLLYAAKLSLEAQHVPRDLSREPLARLDEAIRTVRSIAYELTPGVLREFGLTVALEELVKRIPKGSLSVRLYTEGLQAPLPAGVDIAVYRITQELVNNVLRHAQATRASVRVVREDATLYVGVDDNGVGIDCKAGSDPSGGMGLPSIRNRVAFLGGTFKLVNKPKGGTLVTITIPVSVE